MKEQTRLGLYMLIPAALLWVVRLMFWLDNPLGQYVISQFSDQVIGMVFFIAGLIFPAASLVISLVGLLKKQDLRMNWIITVLAAVFLITMGVYLFIL